MAGEGTGVRGAARISSPFRLLVTLLTTSGDEHDVFVDTDPNATGAELLDALGNFLVPDGDPPYRAVFCERLDLWIDAHARLGTLGLRNGDRFLVAARRLPGIGGSGPTIGAVATELVVTGGPAAGLVAPLAEGVHRVGRGAPSEIRISDTTVSQVHLRIDVQHERVLVSDAGSTNGTYLEGRPLTTPTSIAAGQVLELGATAIMLRPVHDTLADGGALPTDAGTIAFNRPPRTYTPPPRTRIALAAPPDEPTKRRIPLVSAFAPLVLGGVLFLITKNPTTMLFMLLSPIMAVSTVVSDRRSGHREYRQQLHEFDDARAAARTALDVAWADELAARRRAAPDAATLTGLALAHAPELWERRRADPDFLELRIGLADVPAESGVDLAAGGAPKHRATAAPLVDEALLPAVPVVVSLPELGAVGLTGPAAATHPLARWLVVQVATLHSPRDVVVAGVIGGERVGEWHFLRWLPHAQPEVSPLGGECLVSDTSGTLRLLHAATALLDTRREQARTGPASEIPVPRVVLVIDGAVTVPRDITDELLAEGPAFGIYCMWLEQRSRDLPGACGAIAARNDATGLLRLRFAQTGVSIESVAVDGVAREVAERVARGLAPLQDSGARLPGQGVPERLSLLELLELDGPNKDEVTRRWATNRGQYRVAVGASDAGDLSFDIRNDGPHALVGGTTGSGKSELLQTLVASIAASYPPSRMTFLLVDYKGGAAFRECVRLPHTVGLVTDLDPHLTRRALIALDAELKRREGIVREAGSLDELTDVAPDRAPPRLVVIIDEFATLAKELPAFVDGIVDIAQRGRSLGIHLVLATQRPSGVVNDKIRANVNLRIALRVADDAESRDIINAGDAADIPRRLPGRAFLRSGPSELVQFQTAFAGARSHPARGGPRVLVRPVGADGRPVQRDVEQGVDARTDLERLVAAVCAATESQALPRPRAPWLPALADVVPLATLSAGSVDPLEESTVVLGLADEPSLQRQRPFVLALERDGSALVYGAGGSGKTTLLRTIAAGMAARPRPQTFMSM